MTVTIADIEKAATVIADDVIRTPTVAAPGALRDPRDVARLGAAQRSFVRTRA